MSLSVTRSPHGQGTAKLDPAGPVSCVCYFLGKSGHTEATLVWRQPLGGAEYPHEISHKT